MKHISLLLLAVLISLNACKKEETDTRRPTTTPGKYLSKVNSWQTNTNTEVTSSSFEMNTDGELTSVKTFAANSEALLNLTSFTKDGSGKITRATGTYKGQPVAYVFEYDGNGNVASQTYTTGDAPAITTQYTYDGSHRIIKIEEMENGVVTTTRTYTYAATGNNPTGMELVTKGTQGAMGYRYTFDDKKNPYLSLPKIIYYLGIGEFYDDNLLVEIETNGTARKSTYQYGADNYPTSRDDGGGSGIKFYYK
jgi:YD repeat-containing protein